LRMSATDQRNGGWICCQLGAREHYVRTSDSPTQQASAPGHGLPRGPYDGRGVRPQLRQHRLRGSVEIRRTEGAASADAIAHFVSRNYSRSRNRGTAGVFSSKQTRRLQGGHRVPQRALAVVLIGFKLGS
jgi:hypothetical protein